MSTSKGLRLAIQVVASCRTATQLRKKHRGASACSKRCTTPHGSRDTWRPSFYGSTTEANITGWLPCTPPRSVVGGHRCHRLVDATHKFSPASDEIRRVSAFLLGVAADAFRLIEPGVQETLVPRGIKSNQKVIKIKHK